MVSSLSHRLQYVYMLKEATRLRAAQTTICQEMSFSDGYGDLPEQSQKPVIDGLEEACHIEFVADKQMIAMRLKGGYLGWPVVEEYLGWRTLVDLAAGEKGKREAGGLSGIVSSFNLGGVNWG